MAPAFSHTQTGKETGTTGAKSVTVHTDVCFQVERNTLHVWETHQRRLAQGSNQQSLLISTLMLPVRKIAQSEQYGMISEDYLVTTPLLKKLILNGNWKQ